MTANLVALLVFQCGSLKEKELINVVAVVTRYFGGIKLGTGGLIRAYSHALSHTLDEIGLVIGKLQQELLITIAYPLLGKAQAFLEHSPYTLKETIYTESIQLICLVDEQATETFIAEMTDLLNGQLTIEKAQQAITNYHLTKKEHKQMTFEEVLPQIKAGKSRT